MGKIKSLRRKEGETDEYHASDHDGEEFARLKDLLDRKGEEAEGVIGQPRARRHHQAHGKILSAFEEEVVECCEAILSW